MIIRPYESSDENSWLRCRVLAFLDTAYYDNVLREKEQYENDSIELVAVKDGKVVGLIDIEIENEPAEVCSNPDTRSAMIWHLAVHPDYRRRGIARELLRTVVQLLRRRGIHRIEAWTRDDPGTIKWYEEHGFSKVNSYLQVYVEGNLELKSSLQSKVEKLFFVSAFAHYVGQDKERIRSQYRRIHETSQYELWIMEE